MIHQYKSNGYNIVMDVNSGAVHVVDDVTYDAIELFEDISSSEIVDKLKTDYPFYTEYTITPDAYKGMDADVLTVSVKATLIVSPDLDEETVYQMTKVLFENKDAITTAHSKGAELDPASAVQGISVVPLHPGAERYYKEVGALK